MSQEQAAPAEAQETINPESQEVESSEEILEEEEGADLEASQEQEDEAKPEIKEVKGTKKEEASNIKTFKIKANGKTKEIKLDMSKDADIQKYLELAEGSREKFEEAASLRKQVESLVKELKSNPLAILRNKELGLDVKKLATQILEDELKEMEMTPEQKKLAEMERQLKEYEEEKKRISEEKKSAELEKARMQAMQQFDDEVTEALSSSKLPKSPYVVKRISDTLLEVYNMTDEEGNPMYPEATVKDILPYVEEQINNEIKALFEVAPDDVLESMLGKGRLDKMRKNRIAKAKQTAPKIQETGKPVETKKEEDQKIPMSRFFSPF